MVYYNHLIINLFDLYRIECAILLGVILSFQLVIEVVIIFCYTDGILNYTGGVLGKGFEK